MPSNNSFRKRSAADDRGASSRFSRRQVVGTGALGLFGAAVLSACGSQGDQGKAQSQSGGPSASASQTSAKPAFRPNVTVTPAADTEEFNPATPVAVKTDQGKIDSVTVSGGQKEVKGSVSQDGKTWTSQGSLDFDTRYTVSYTVSQDGTTRDGTSDFTTVVAANEADVKFNVEDGKTYGTGEIIQMDFSEPVADRAAVEKAISVTGGGDQKGKFRWYSDTMVRYRPQDKWAPNSTVTIKAKLLGVEIGNGQVVNQDYTLSFKTGAKHYAYVDNNTKTMKMYVDGKVAREAPVTLGDPEWPSVTGQLVIMEQAKKYHFDASTLGLKKDDPHWYEAFDATNTNRLTESGAFVHQAEPSAYAYVGVANISHGCIGLLPDDAEYFFDTFRVGDVVEVQHTGYPQANPDNGYGDWNIPFANYSDPAWKGNW